LKDHGAHPGEKTIEELKKKHNIIQEITYQNIFAAGSCPELKTPVERL
jgi:FlaA1/EpsC-like NDP-sugar epimerase